MFCGKNSTQSLKDSDSSSLWLTAKLIGWDVVESLEDAPDRVICVDFSNKVGRLIAEAKHRGIPRTLIINEPEVVVPRHSDTKFLAQFDRVVRVGRPGVEDTLFWPQTWRFEKWNESRQPRAVIISADKWSFIKGQLYWLRLGVLSECPSLDLYGRNWTRNYFERVLLRIFELFSTIRMGVRPSFTGFRYLFSRPRNFCGEVEDKVQVMSKYKVALVIENSKELMTEKLFDAWFAGCIPVYVGPPLQAFDLRPDLAIECEADIGSVRRAIEFALSLDYDTYQVRLREHLSNPKTKLRWSSQEALKAILNASV